MLFVMVVTVLVNGEWWCVVKGDVAQGGCRQCSCSRDVQTCNCNSFSANDPYKAFMEHYLISENGNVEEDSIKYKIYKME